MEDEIAKEAQLDFDDDGSQPRPRPIASVSLRTCSPFESASTSRACYTMTSSLTDTWTPFDRFYTCRDQPWRFLYTTYQIGLTLLFRLPFWLFIGLFPWGRLHPQFTVKKAIIIRLIKIILRTALKYVNAHIITQLRFLDIRSRLQNRKAQ